MLSVYQYDDYDYFERVENEKQIEMFVKGFDFITNFDVSKESMYRKAAETHNLKYAIVNEVYSGSGMKITDDGTWMKAFYVDINVGDLSDFWGTFDELKKK
jgi:hypothetical protein